MSHVPNLAATIVVAALVAAVPVAAQESPSYKLTESTFNAGGHPAAGTIPASASYRMSMDAVAEPAVGTGSSSASYRMDASFCAAYPPPGEVRGLRLADKQTLEWDPERSAGTYNLYRALMSDQRGGGYGDCEQADMTEETTTDATEPPVEDGYFYLVTAQNRLDEEGTKGTDSYGGERPNSNPCP